MQSAEVAHEVVAREAGHARHVVERDRLGVAGVDVVGGQAQAALELVARRAARRLARRGLGTPLLHRQLAQQHERLLVEPIVVALARQHGVAQRAQALRDGIAVAAQVLGELQLARCRVGLFEHMLQGQRQRSGHFLLQAGAKEDGERKCRPQRFEFAAVGPAFVEHQPMVVVDRHFSLTQEVALAPAPGSLDRQGLGVGGIGRIAAAAADDGVLAAPARIEHAPERGVRRGRRPRRQVGHRGQYHGLRAPSLPRRAKTDKLRRTCRSGRHSRSGLAGRHNWRRSCPGSWCCRRRWSTAGCGRTDCECRRAARGS